MPATSPEESGTHAKDARPGSPSDGSEPTASAIAEPASRFPWASFSTVSVLAVCLAALVVAIGAIANAGRDSGTAAFSPDLPAMQADPGAPGAWTGTSPDGVKITLTSDEPRDPSFGGDLEIDDLGFECSGPLVPDATLGERFGFTYDGWPDCLNALVVLVPRGLDLEVLDFYLRSESGRYAEVPLSAVLEYR